MRRKTLHVVERQEIVWLEASKLSHLQPFLRIPRIQKFRESQKEFRENSEREYREFKQRGSERGVTILVKHFFIRHDANSTIPAKHMDLKSNYLVRSFIA